MTKRLLISALLVLAIAVTPTSALLQDIQLVDMTVQDDRIVFVVDNAGESAEVVRVQVVVRLSDGSTELLTSSTVTVPGSATSSVSVTAKGTIVAIIDDPQPVTP